MATVMFTNDDRLIYKVFAIHLSLKYTEILSKHSNRTYKHDAPEFLVIGATVRKEALLVTGGGLNRWDDVSICMQLSSWV